jgi:hypothetical protein
MSSMIIEADIITREEPEVEGLLAQLPVWLQDSGLILKQKRHYRVGKLSLTRNWCQLFSEDYPRRVALLDSCGRTKTWRLFARFSHRQPPAWPWDRPVLEAGKGILAGSDVWGVAGEDVREWYQTVPSGQLLARLASDLCISFEYSRRCYL